MSLYAAISALALAVLWAYVGEQLVTKSRLARLIGARGFARTVLTMALLFGPLGLLGAVAAEVEMGWKRR